MHGYFVPAVTLLLLSGCASLTAPAGTGEPTTFVTGVSAAAQGDAQMKTTDVPSSDSMMEDAPKFLPLRWFFGGH